MPRGVVRDMMPDPLGYVADNGSVVSTQGQTIGQVQLNGTVINPQGDVIGAVFNPAQLALGFDGTVLGTLSADGMLLATQEIFAGSYATPTGLIVARNGRVIGQTVRQGAAITLDREVSAWISDKGEVYNKSKQVIGRVMPDGTVVDAQQQLVAQVIPTGTVTDLAGQFVGNVSADGRVISAYGLDLGAFPYDDRLMNIKDNWVGRRLPAGAVLDAMGHVIGTLRFDAAVLNKEKKNIGAVLPDNRVVGEDQIVGQFVPYGAPVQDEHGRVSGFMCFDGVVRDAKGRVLGSLIGQQVVDEHDRIVAYLMLRQGFAIDSQGKIVGHIFPSGSASSVGEDEAQENSMLPSGEVISPTGQVIGQRAPFGLALGLDDNTLGNALEDGRVLLGGVATVEVHPDSVLYDKMQRVRGAIGPLGVFINREGHIVGKTSVSTAVEDLLGERAGTMLPAGAAFKDADKLLGLPMPQTAVVDDDAHVVGIVAADGSVISRQKMVGRITAGGVAVQASESEPFGLMPEIGRAVSGHVSVPMRDGAVGFVQLSGHVVDAKKNVIGYVADDGNVMSLQCEIIASTVQKGSIVDAQGIVIGSVGVDGKALRADGSVLGRLASDGSVKGSHVLKIFGQVVPTGIVTNETCEIIGQARPDGRVLDGKGTVVGSMQMGGAVYSSLGVKLGAIAPQGTIVDTTGTVFGRALANADAVDTKGTLMGCVLPDGQVLDTSREHLGSVLKRGLVVNTKGRVIGRVKKDGSVVSPDCQNTVIGQALDDGHVVDFKNQVIGAIFDPQQEQILYSEQGTVQGSVSADGVVRNVLGMPAFVALSNGDIQSMEGKLLARVDASGNMTDTSGQVVALVTSIGFNPEMPNFVCEGNECHVMPANTIPATAKEVDCRGQKCFVDLANNLVFDKNNKVVAFLNPETGAMIYVGDDSPVAKQIDPAKLKKMRDLLREKRASMKRGIMDKITPDARLLARAKDKMDKSLGGKIVSSWPVKMDRMIMKDKAIPAVLQRSIDSRNVNVPITAVVERHIYAEDGRNIIIPAGSRLLGKAESGGGLNRVAKIGISWERLVRPDGGTFHFAAVSGDAQGRGGVAGYLDEQFLARYGKPILETSLVSAISYLIAVDEAKTTNAQYGTVTQSDRAEAAQDARRNFIETMQHIFEQMIEESSTVPPVVFIPAGTRLTVFSNEDLWLRSEEEDVDDYEAEYGSDTKQVRQPEARFGNSATYAPDDDTHEKKEVKRETETQEKPKEKETYIPSSIEDFYANTSGNGSNSGAPERISTPLNTTTKTQKKQQSSFGFF
ncbi:MAG: TrbI/VirB10 family protein [Alphaproteobacteria bacterium]|nr:TrbI/VirB10 family protein [Alphaproteobacteria bacterium]